MHDEVLHELHRIQRRLAEVHAVLVAALHAPIFERELMSSALANLEAINADLVSYAATVGTTIAAALASGDNPAVDAQVVALQGNIATLKTNIAAATTTTASAGQLAFTTTTLPDATVGGSYSGSVQTSGGTAPVTVATSGAPAGITFNADGTGGGSATGPDGISQVTFTATDAATPPATATLTLPLSVTG